MIVCIAAYAVGSVQPHGLAGTLERVGLIVPMIWMFSFLRRLRDGTPFMIQP
jgi:hypothetical protein